MDVVIMMGSKSDMAVMEKAADILKDFGVSFEVHVASAHRSPARVAHIIGKAHDAGVKIFIAAAGLAAHLAGVVASQTDRPVIGVPMDGGSLQGMDALLSTVQMPGGVPVAGMAIGSHGAKNAAYMAVRILALSNPEVAEKNRRFIQEQAATVGL